MRCLGVLSGPGEDVSHGKQIPTRIPYAPAAPNKHEYTLKGRFPEGPKPAQPIRLTYTAKTLRSSIPVDP
jgi:hypothetical protein